MRRFRPDPRAVNLTRRASRTLALLLCLNSVVLGCGGETDPAKGTAEADTGLSIRFGDGATLDSAQTDTGTATADTSVDDTAGAADASVEDSTADAADTTDAGNDDTAGDTSSSPIIALKLTLPDSLILAGSTAIELAAKDSQGTTFDAAANPALVVKINGQAQTVGFDLAAGSAAVQPIAVWKDKTGALRLVGVRPGKASVVAQIGAALSPPVEVEVGWPEGDGIWAAVPDAAGKTDAEQILDVPEAIKISGSTIGGGGLDASVRFASSSTGGNVLELGKAPTLAVAAGFADLAGTKYSGAQGWIWIDQTNKGVFRGTAWVRSTSLKPLVVVFRIERNGTFGIDTLDDEATDLAKSDNIEPTTGTHHSRVSVLVGAPGTQRFHVVWREIENGLKARLRRVDVDAKSGAIDTSPQPLIDDLNAYDTTPDVPAAAIGTVRLAWSSGKGLLVWEGRDAKGATKPHRLFAAMVDADLAFLSPPLALSDDACAGSCRPEVRGLSSGRFLVVWSGPNGGVFARRIKGILEAGALAPVETPAVTLAASGKDSSVAVHGTNVLMTWFDPDQGPIWRLYQDKATGSLSATAPAQGFGISSPQAPPVTVDALTLATGAPNLLFATAWIDLLPTQATFTRSVGLDGNAIGKATEATSLVWDTIRARAGKPGQLLLIGRPADGAIVARKRTYQSYGDIGSNLGEVATMAPGGADAVDAVYAWNADADVWLVAWSGNQKSKGVWMRRFR